MANITRGSASIEEIEDMTFSKGRLTTVYAKYSFDARKDGDYAFSDSIRHPDTGEVLKPVKGYCTDGSSFGRPCYYAEYEGESGTYYYFDQTKYNRSLPGAMTIRQQLDEDREAYKEKFAKNSSAEEDYRGETDDINEENFDGEKTIEEDYQGETDDINEENFDGEKTYEQDYQGETDNITEDNFDSTDMNNNNSGDGKSTENSVDSKANGEGQSF